MAEEVITARSLTKHYREVRAVDGIDLSIRRGEIYGFLGRNGAGKTTTIRMLLGLIRPTAGSIRLLGDETATRKILGRVGSLVETATAYPNLSVRENLELHRRLTDSPPKAVDRAITLLGLERYADRRAGKLSLGNKQRLSLSRALLHEPEILILDEPANGLDPAGIVEIRQLLRSLADDHRVTIFLSSHILSEIAQLADRTGIIHDGRMIADFGRGELHARTRTVLRVGVSEPERAVDILRRELAIEQIEREPDGTLRLFEAASRSSEVARVLVTAGLELTRLAAEEEDLEDFFMRLTAEASS